MSTRAKRLSREEIGAAFTAAEGPTVPPIVSPSQLAAILNISTKTLYEWIAKGRLDGAYRKRGKHNLIWRDRALEIIFNGPEWTT